MEQKKQMSGAGLFLSASWSVIRLALMIVAAGAFARIGYELFMLGWRILP